MSNDPYNPLDKTSLGKNVAEAVLKAEPHKLPLTEPFEGAGIYALYYIGEFRLYEPMATRNLSGQHEIPIYVGKAVPPGSRKGGYGLGIQTGSVLWKRINEHSKSIEQCENLNLSDFFCRHLIVDDIWIPLGESLLIEKFNPLWNKVVDGFGNHDPGSGRYNQQKSLWDVLHPGRRWADKLQQNTVSITQIQARVKDHLK